MSYEFTREQLTEGTDRWNNAGAPKRLLFLALSHRVQASCEKKNGHVASQPGARKEGPTECDPSHTGLAVRGEAGASCDIGL
jgi:hypothetical protein